MKILEFIRMIGRCHTSLCWFRWINNWLVMILCTIWITLEGSNIDQPRSMEAFWINRSFGWKPLTFQSQYFTIPFPFYKIIVKISVGWIPLKYQGACSNSFFQIDQTSNRARINQRNKLCGIWYQIFALNRSNSNKSHKIDGARCDIRNYDSRFLRRNTFFFHFSRITWFKRDHWQSYQRWNTIFITRWYRNISHRANESSIWVP